MAHSLRSFAAPLRAASGRYADALRHVRHALELRPDYQPALDNLARLQRMGVK